MNHKYIAINRSAYQVLETMYIIQNSKAPDTVIGRLQLLDDLVTNLRDNYNNKQYLTAIQEAIDSYKVGYYDRTPTDITLNILLKPHLNIREELHCVCVYNSFGKLFEDFVDAYKQLKQEKAKENRKKRILEVLHYVRDSIQSNGSGAPSYRKIMKSLDDIEALVNSNDTFDDITFAQG